MSILLLQEIYLGDQEVSQKFVSTWKGSAMQVVGSSGAFSGLCIVEFYLQLSLSRIHASLDSNSFSSYPKSTGMLHIKLLYAYFIS